MTAITNNYNKPTGFIIKSIQPPYDNIEYFTHFDKDGYTPGFTNQKKKAKIFQDYHHALFSFRKMQRYWNSLWWKIFILQDFFSITSNTKLTNQPETRFEFYLKSTKTK